MKTLFVGGNVWTCVGLPSGSALWLFTGGGEQRQHTEREQQAARQNVPDGGGGVTGVKQGGG